MSSSATPITSGCSCTSSQPSPVSTPNSSGSGGREYERRVEGVFEAGADSGQFRQLDPRLAARAWLGMHNYTYLWLKAGGRLSAKQVATSFADIFVHGIAKP